MRKLILIITLIVNYYNCFSQLSTNDSLRIDSLINVSRTSLNDVLNYEIHKEIGLIYYQVGYLDKSISQFNKSIVFSEREKHYEKTINSLYFIAKTYSIKGDYRKGLEYIILGEEKLNLINNKAVRDSIESTLSFFKGVQYRNLYDYNKSKINLQKALSFFVQNQDSNKVSYTCINLSWIFLENSEIDSSKKYLTIGNNYSISNNSMIHLKNIEAEILILENDLINAKILYEDIYQFWKNQDNVYYTISCLNSLIEIDNSVNGHSKRLQEALEVYTYFETYEYNDLERMLAKNIAEMLEKENRYKESVLYFKKHLSISESIDSEQKIKDLAYLENKQKNILDSIEYQNKSILKDKQIALEKEQVEKYQQRQYLGILIGVISVIFFFILYRRYIITKRQKEKISNQSIKINKQHYKLEETHKEITDSINYAKRLQDAILPSFSDINEHIQNNFVLFEPKDVVSGDFYWFENKNNILLIASADCTGHGVPGAMVSVVCSNALHRTVNEFNIIEPSKILDKTRELVIETFAKSGENVKDGMDIALCALSDNKVVFSGANNPLWIVRNTKELSTEQLEHRSTCVIEELALIEFKANKQPIGLYEGMKPFTQTEINLLKGDTLYFFTDGFADQFGGEKGKKFKYKPFKRLLIEISAKPMEEQKEIIQNTFNSWKGEIEQVDDVCIIGIKIT